MSKRRVFDIDFDDVEPEVAPVSDAPLPEARRGPMASAISENAAALTERQAAETAIRAENDRLAHEYIALKKNGQIVGLIDIGSVKMSKLIRDRSGTRDPELEELKASIRALGLSNPIHVEEVEGGFELIQGFRRLTAYRELFHETGEARFARIPATLQAKGAQLDQLYRRMVDENLVRRDISFAEMAQLAMSYAARTPEIRSSADAVDDLFASAGRQKRSYIRHFATLLDALGQDLKFPEVIPRATGLALVRLIEGNDRAAGQIRAVLNARPDRDAAGELAILRSAASGGAAKPAVSKAPAPKSSSKTTIKLNRPEGVAKCTASAGRFEVLLDHDFGAVDPRRLEAAARAFLDRLKG
ncbi:ParB/RepB/Spo0J family partition protein [Sulfitobacter sabulilitoris]|uniref:Chromosome partitioning protein ParB n=1 Tax=Sulfitobacter sabulilitoris TaxID=2562655 RepID=A0A5S3PCS3_9RHOB|nr:ParB N-terminal domain-containing protein [Sulfitobacter sabulilitoris]TMM50565.1 chromosome partitioning protein ParB [Sulfitobacter sabulilitoris]